MVKVGDVYRSASGECVAVYEIGALNAKRCRVVVLNGRYRGSLHLYWTDDFASWDKVEV